MVQRHPHEAVGYTVPTTWPQYEALGLKLAKQHPGYYVAMLGDTYAVERYLWGSGCPTNDLIGPNKVLINLNDPDLHPGRDDARRPHRGQGGLTGGCLRH